MSLHAQLEFTNSSRGQNSIRQRGLTGWEGCDLLERARREVGVDMLALHMHSET